MSRKALRPTELPALGVFAVAARHQNFAHAADESQRAQAARALRRLDAAYEFVRAARAG